LTLDKLVLFCLRNVESNGNIKKNQEIGRFYD